MSAPPAVRRAAELDDLFGDPWDERSLISHAESVDLDQRSRFPQRAFDAVNRSGLQADYVPAEFGGTLTDLLTPVLGVRAVARRDLTAAVAHGKTLLGAISAWVAAPEAARDVLAPMVLAGEQISWGLTERGRGSDLMATATTAVVAADGSTTLDGEKWMVNNATRGRAMTVLARTSDTPGPRGLSLVFLDKRETGAGSLGGREKIATHGIRGADISGLGFTRALLPPGRLIGEAGYGLDIVLKSLQVTRALCTGLSLGAGDALLHAAARLADEHQLFGGRLGDLPAARDTLADAVTDMAIAEVVSLAGARHLQLLPQEAAVVSPAVKYLVPYLTDQVAARLQPFIGARAVLTGGPYGHVQKTVRDGRVVGIFDGNSSVCLHAVVNELPAAGRHVAEPAALPEGLLSPMPPAGAWDPGRLRLRTRAGSTLVRHLPRLVDQAADLLGPRGRDVAAAVVARADGLLADVAGRQAGRHPEPEWFRAAHEYAVVFATAAVCAHAVGNHAAGAYWSVPGRLDHALDRLIRLLDPSRTTVPPHPVPATAGQAEAAEGLVAAVLHTPGGRAVTSLGGSL